MYVLYCGFNSYLLISEELFFFYVLTFYFYLNLNFIIIFRNKSILYIYIHSIIFFFDFYKIGFVKSTLYYYNYILLHFVYYISLYWQFRYKLNTYIFKKNNKVYNEFYNIINEEEQNTRLFTINKQWSMNFNKLINKTHRTIIKKRNKIFHFCNFTTKIDPSLFKFKKVSKKQYLNKLVMFNNFSFIITLLKLLNIFFFFFDFLTYLIINFIYFSFISWKPLNIKLPYLKLKN